MHRRINEDMVSGSRRTAVPTAVPAPAPGHRLSREDVMRLQRTAGNQATRRMLQRAPVAPAAYFTGIYAASGTDPEWDPKWTKALGIVAADPLLGLGFGGNTIDDASESEAHKVIAVLAALKTLSSAKPNPFVAAIDAVRFHWGIESDSGGSGFGSLDTSGKEFGGRPAFPQITQKTFTLQAGQHRRHIFAWHDLREFMQIAYAAQPKTVIGTIEAAFYEADQAAGNAFAEAYELMIGSREKTKTKSDKTTDAEWLKIALFVMNGNPRNLWAGRGSTNSAINTAQMAMTKELDAVTTFAGVGVLVTKWSGDKGKEVYNTATTLASQVLLQEGTLAASTWDHEGKPPLREAELVKGVTKQVSQWVVSNLQVDLLGDTKAQTEHIQQMSKELKDTRQFMDNIVRNPDLIKDLPPQLLAHLIRDFLSYM